MEANYFTILWWFLPYIHLNQPRVYRCPPTLNPLPPPSPPQPSGFSQSTSFGCPASCMELAQVIYFTHGSMHVSIPWLPISTVLLLPFTLPPSGQISLSLFSFSFLFLFRPLQCQHLFVDKQTVTESRLTSRRNISERKRK